MWVTGRGGKSALTEREALEWGFAQSRSSLNRPRGKDPGDQREQHVRRLRGKKQHGASGRPEHSVGWRVEHYGETEGGRGDRQGEVSP